MAKNTIQTPANDLSAAFEAETRCQPESLSDLYWSFTRLALQGFGGVLAVAQRELVEKKRWLTQQEFVEEWAVAQILPGPNVVNLSLMIGDRYFGLRGALTALAGMISVPMVVVLCMAALYAPFASLPWVAGALKGMGAVCAGLITATGLKLLPALKGNPLGAFASAFFLLATVAAVAWLRLPLAQVLLGTGGLACLMAWQRLRQGASPAKTKP